MRWLRPIPEAWVEWHFTLFLWLMALGMFALLIEQLPEHPRGDLIGFTNSMIRGMAPVILVSAAISTVIVEGALIFAERYLKYRYERGKDEERQRWKEWNDRREAAESAGDDFTEPNPAEFELLQRSEMER